MQCVLMSVQTHDARTERAACRGRGDRETYKPLWACSSRGFLLSGSDTRGNYEERKTPRCIGRRDSVAAPSSFERNATKCTAGANFVPYGDAAT